jgi:hypothetical protein
MDASGITFAILMMALAIPVAVILYRNWDSLQSERFFGTVFVASTLLLGVVSIARYAGRMEDGPAYQTLDISLSALSSVMLLLLFVAEWKRRRPGASGRPT